VIKKIFSVILIVIGAFLLLVFVLSSLSSNGPDSNDPAFIFGYYLVPFTILVFGVGLIIFGIIIRRRIKRKKIEKELLDTLPKS
jgi:pilus assembly protein TadC